LVLPLMGCELDSKGLTDPNVGVASQPATLLQAASGEDALSELGAMARAEMLSEEALSFLDAVGSQALPSKDAEGGSSISSTGTGEVAHIQAPSMTIVNEVATDPEGSTEVSFSAGTWATPDPTKVTVHGNYEVDGNWLCLTGGAIEEVTYPQNYVAYWRFYWIPPACAPVGAVQTTEHHAEFDIEEHDGLYDWMMDAALFGDGSGGLDSVER